MRKKKKQFKPNTTILNLKKDFPLEQDIELEFWLDPSRQIIFDLFEIIGATTEEVEESTDEEKIRMSKRYYECASLILIDCDIEGIDFSTAESTEAAFEDERLPWGIFHQAMVLYLDKLMTEYDMLKNVLRRANVPSDSGETNNNVETE
jgi:hypothetical protein